MSKKAFKVGDRVRVIRKGRTCSNYVEFIENNAPKYIGNFQMGHAPNNGDIGVVVGMGNRYENHDPCLAVLSEDKAFCIEEIGVELISFPSIHITVDGNKTISVMKEGKQEIGRGVATCNPSDDFDFKTGAKLAMDRLLGEEIKGDFVTGVIEVSRKAKVGEYIKIVKKGNHGPWLVIGDIHKVTNVTKDYIDTDKSNIFQNYETHEYVVLENYNPNATVQQPKSEEPQDEYLSFKKVKRKAEVGEYVLIVNAECSLGNYKNNDILKIIDINDDREEFYYKGNFDTYLFEREYVVLEGYQPPKTFENKLTKEEVLKAVEKALEK